jgi:hypothetical protein
VIDVLTAVIAAKVKHFRADVCATRPARAKTMTQIGSRRANCQQKSLGQCEQEVYRQDPTVLAQDQASAAGPVANRRRV